MSHPTMLDEVGPISWNDREMILCPSGITLGDLKAANVISARAWDCLFLHNYQTMKNSVVKKNLQICFRQFSPHCWVLNEIFPVDVRYCIHKRRNISITSSPYLPYLFSSLFVIYRVNMLYHVLFALSVFITVNILFLHPVRMLRKFGVTS